MTTKPDDKHLDHPLIDKLVRDVASIDTNAIENAIDDKPSAPEGSVCAECGAPAHWLYDNEPLCKPHWYATERVNE